MIRNNNTAVLDDEPNSLWEFLGRAVLWGIKAKLGGSSHQKVFELAAFGPLLEKAFNFKLEEVLYQIEQNRKQHELLEQQEQQKRALLEAQKKLKVDTSKAVTQIPSLSEQPEPKTIKKVEPEMNSKWLDVVKHPSVILIIGKRGSGKSALAYWLLELFRCSVAPHVLGAPKHLAKMLPDWIGIKEDIENVTAGGIVLVDEAHLLFNARDSQTARNRAISRIINLSRHRGLSLIFVTQEARHIDKNIVGSTDVLIFKDMGMLQLGFDRPPLRTLVEKAGEAFKKVSVDRKRYSYIYSSDADYEGLLMNELPTFWSDKLSKAYAGGVGNAETRNPKKMTKADKIQHAKQKAQEGKPYSEIAKEMGVSKGTVFNWVNDYPYKVR